MYEYYWEYILCVYIQIRIYTYTHRISVYNECLNIEEATIVDTLALVGIPLVPARTAVCICARYSQVCSTNAQHPCWADDNADTDDNIKIEAEATHSTYSTHRFDSVYNAGKWIDLVCMEQAGRHQKTHTHTFYPRYIGRILQYTRSFDYSDVRVYNTRIREYERFIHRTNWKKFPQMPSIHLEISLMLTLQKY